VNGHDTELDVHMGGQSLELTVARYERTMLSSKSGRSQLSQPSAFSEYTEGAASYSSASTLHTPTNVPRHSTTEGPRCCRTYRVTISRESEPWGIKLDLGTRHVLGVATPSALQRYNSTTLGEQVQEGDLLLSCNGDGGPDLSIHFQGAELELVLCRPHWSRFSTTLARASNERWGLAIQPDSNIITSTEPNATWRATCVEPLLFGDVLERANGDAHVARVLESTSVTFDVLRRCPPLLVDEYYSQVILRRGSSWGLRMDPDTGTVASSVDAIVVHGSLGAGDVIVTVDGRPWSPAALRDSAERGLLEVELLVVKNDETSSVSSVSERSALSVPC